MSSRLGMLVLALPALGLATGALTACATTRSPATTIAHQATSPSAVRLLNRGADGIGIQGYDPVAYFEVGEPVKGDPRYHATYLGTTYHFSTEARLWTFQEHPERYAPLFGGFCAYAVSIDRLSPIEPENFQIVEERLVLNHNAHAHQLWLEDVEGNLAKARANWPDLVAENGHPEHLLVNVDADGVAVSGYDVISYREGAPMLGLPEHASSYGGATYHFASKANRSTFEVNPEKYVPAYGGFCAYAVSDGRLRPIDPLIFQIEDDRLLLQHSQQAYDLFNRDTPASVRQAGRNWPELEARSAL